MFEIVGWIISGMLLALVVRVGLRIKDPDGVTVTLLLSIAGALLGGFLSIALTPVEYGDRGTLFAACLGAVAALGLKTWTVRFEERSR